jgi:hypothetical protein
VLLLIAARAAAYNSFTTSRRSTTTTSSSSRSTMLSMNRISGTEMVDKPGYVIPSTIVYSPTGSEEQRYCVLLRLQWFAAVVLLLL